MLSKAERLARALRWYERLDQFDRVYWFSFDYPVESMSEYDKDLVVAVYERAR